MNKNTLNQIFSKSIVHDSRIVILNCKIIYYSFLLSIYFQNYIHIFQQLDLNSLLILIHTILLCFASKISCNILYILYVTHASRTPRGMLFRVWYYIWYTSQTFNSPQHCINSLVAHWSVDIFVSLCSYRTEVRINNSRLLFRKKDLS